MSVCISLHDFLEISRPQLEEFRVLSERFAGGHCADDCEAFYRQAHVVEGLMRHAFGMCSGLARESDDLHEISGIWLDMSSLCHSALTMLSALKDQYPDCGTTELYDLILDFKLAADKHYDHVQEEIACQSIPTPNGLFPGTI